MRETDSFVGMTDRLDFDARIVRAVDGNGGIMISNKNLVLVFGLAGWALTYVIAKSRKEAQRREKRIQKKQMTTWEGEGGNLPPPASSTPHFGLH